MRRTVAWAAGGGLAALLALAAGSAWFVLYLYREKRPDASLLDPELQRAWLQVMGAAVSLLVAGGFSLMERRPRAPKQAADYGSHGSARWAQSSELRQRLATSGPGLIVGQLPPLNRGAPPRYLIHPPRPRGLNQFVLVFGGAGSYKSASYVIPNLLHETETSVVCPDPKGECWRETAAVKAAQNYRIEVMDFINFQRSRRWNPLDYVHTPQDALRLAATIIANTDNPNVGKTGGDPFWPMAEQAFITALVLYVKLHRPADEHHLANVLTLGTELDQEQLNALFDALKPDDPARRYYRTFHRAEEKVRSGIVIGFATRLQLWNDDAVIRLTAASDFDLRDLGRQKTVLYVIIPAGERTYAPLLALFWNQMAQELTRLADSHDGRLPVPVRMRMEEAANIGTIPDLEQRVSTTRGLGIWWEFIFQTLGQFKARYPGVWSEIAGNCDTWLYLGGNDLETQEYISTRLGNTTIQIQATSTGKTTQGETAGESAQYTARALQMADELGRLPESKQVLLQRGHAPALVDKPFYKQHPAYRNPPGSPPAPISNGDSAPTMIDVAKLAPPKKGSQAKTKPAEKKEEDD